jgi:hypothetical protein
VIQVRRDKMVPQGNRVRLVIEEIQGRKVPMEKMVLKVQLVIVVLEEIQVI